MVFFIGRGDWIRTSDLLVPNQTRYQTALHPEKNGANVGIRTPDLLITNQLLYRLSYIGNSCFSIIGKRTYSVKSF
jgi:hypothetical protein